MVNWFQFYKILLKKEFRTHYPTWFSLLFFIAGEVLLIWVYKLTSTTLTPRIPFRDAIGNDYFSFVMIGHLTLLLPMAVMQQTVKVLREQIHFRSFHRLRTSSGSAIVNIIALGLPKIAIRTLHVIVSIFALLAIFQWSIPNNFWGPFWTLQFLFLPTFLGIGLFAGAIVLWWGRGERLVFAASGLAHIFAGAYFPTAALPTTLETALNGLSPFNQILRQTRLSASGLGFDTGLIVGLALIWTFITMSVGLWSLNLAVKHQGKRKQPLLLLNS